MTLLTARGLVKRYGGVPVLKDVDLDVEAGEIHALVGENGAGKSTLIKILAGAVRPDAGTVTLAGRPLPAGDPVDARRRGVSVVHQEFTLVPDLSVADNITLGREPSWWHAPAAVRRRAAVPLHRLGIAIDPSAKVRTLSVASQQLVEIARALAADARVLILDEPTAALPPGEIERLFTVLRDLRSGGLGIVYISHRLDEVFTLADRITVLRDGAIVRRAVPAELTRAELITAMIGRELSAEFPERHPSPGEAVLETAGLCSPPGVRDVSFSVRAGEILGVAGLAGAGRTSTALALAGARRSTGSMRVRGRAVSFRSPHEAVAAGVVYVTEDRKARGIIPTMAIGPNVTLASLRQFASGGWLRTRDEGRAVREAAARFDVRAGSLQQLITTLSGGNQQKVLLARAALATPAVLILDEPTRGVDVGARAEIYAFMNQLTASGLAVLMISSDLPEVLGMSDRIVVMREGRTVGELGRAAATADAVMSLAARAA